eukprot:SAG31_NODE_44_length_31168_cov_16.507290_19_plen_124_part_00
MSMPSTFVTGTSKVHFHRVAFQIIYCLKGWVRLSYEGQGPPFVLRAGDCVLQPPTIRHRVLESGDGLEVVELGVVFLRLTSSCEIGIAIALHEWHAAMSMSARLPSGTRDAHGSRHNLASASV